MTFTVSKISPRSAQLDTTYPAFRSVSKWNVGLAKKSPLGVTAGAEPGGAGAAPLLSAVCTGGVRPVAARPAAKTARAVRRATGELLTDIFISSGPATSWRREWALMIE